MHPIAFCRRIAAADFCAGYASRATANAPAQPGSQPDRRQAGLAGSLRAGALRRPVTSTLGLIKHGALQCPIKTMPGMPRTIRSADRWPPESQAADSSVCQMWGSAKDEVHYVGSLGGPGCGYFVKRYGLCNYLASAVAISYGCGTRWSIGRRHSSRHFYPRPSNTTRHCLFSRQAVRPNPSFHRTLRIKPRKAGEFKR